MYVFGVAHPLNLLHSYMQIQPFLAFLAILYIALHTLFSIINNTIITYIIFVHTYYKVNMFVTGHCGTYLFYPWQCDITK